MGFLDTYFILGISGTIIFILAILVLGYLLYSNRDEQGEKAESNRKIMSAILVVLVVAVVISASGYTFGTPPPTGSSKALSGVLTMVPSSSCFAFSGVTFSLACNQAATSYRTTLVNNGTNGGQSGASVTVGALAKYIGNTLYVPGGGTTNANEVSVSFTIRRTDVGFTDPACAGYCTAAVSASMSTLQGVGVKANKTALAGSTVLLLAQDVYGNYQEGWTDTNSNTVVGSENANGIMSLAPNGGSNTIKFAFVLNQVGLPQNIPFTTTTFTATFTITMSFATTPSGTSASSVTWSVPLTLTLTSVA